MKNKLIFLTTLISVISLTACSFIRKHKIDSSDVTSISSSIDSKHEHIPGGPVTEGRVEPTCTEDGYYYSVVYCTECHKELSRERMTLEHLGHDIHIGEAHTPTCEEAGWEEYEYCSRCDYSTKVVISPIDHDYVLDPETHEYRCKYCGLYGGKEYNMTFDFLENVYVGYNARDIMPYYVTLTPEDHTFVIEWWEWVLTDDNGNTVKLIDCSEEYRFEEQYVGNNLRVDMYITVMHPENAMFSNDHTQITNLTVKTGNRELTKGTTKERYESLGYGYSLDFGPLQLDPEPVPQFDPDDSSYFTYGLYPQTHVNDGGLAHQLDLQVYYGATPVLNDWYLYEGNYYARVMGTEQTNGVVFDDGSQIAKNYPYWFKVEPIEWVILKDFNGQYYTAITNKLLDIHCFNESDEEREIDGRTIYPNNYEYSDMRKYLNGDFIDYAFPEGHEHLSVTTVNNRASTTENGNNPYAGQETEDKVYLLSYQECSANGYYPYDYSRSAFLTDYAKAKGATCFLYHSTYHYGTYWTRSPSSANQYWVTRINGGGAMNYSSSINEKNICIRPAIYMRLVVH